MTGTEFSLSQNSCLLFKGEHSPDPFRLLHQLRAQDLQIPIN